MNDYRYFDVLIVYSGEEAKSAGKRIGDTDSPFPISGTNANYNDAYAYFLEACKRQGLSAAFSTSADVIDAGMCSSYWLYEDSIWKQIAKPCYSRQIFDKLSPVHEKARRERDLLFSSSQVNPFNNDDLSNLFADKLETYENLSNYSIPTIEIDDDSRMGIKKSVIKLKKLTGKHQDHADFSSEIILKDRFGAGGNEIYKLNEDYSNQIFDIVNAKNKYSFILQPFLNFQQGFAYKKMTVATDIRLIFQNEKLIQTYFRMAKPDDFRCNEHKGGKLVYVNLRDIPKKVLQVARKMISTIQQKRSLLALDFVVSDNGNVFFLEGNTGPGIDWNLNLKKNELMSKKLIRLIVKELQVRVFEDRTQHAQHPPMIYPPVFLKY